jgi:hypothetical protein
MASKLMSRRDSFDKRQELIGISSVALAGVIQVSTSPGPFNIWNLIIGIPLVLVLAVFSRSHSLILVERLALASIWGFTLMSAGGYFLQALYRSLHGLMPIFDALEADWEAPGNYYLAWMMVFSIVAYIILTLRQRPSRG